MTRTDMIFKLEVLNTHVANRTYTIHPSKNSHERVSYDRHDINRWISFLYSRNFFLLRESDPQTIQEIMERANMIWELTRRDAK